MSRRGEGGFTLIEALVALAVMGMAVVTMTAATSRALRVEAATLAHLEAVALADARMNEIASLPFSALQPWEGTRTGRFEDGNERFGWAATVAGVPGSGSLFRVVVRVDWPEGSVELSSVVHRTPRLGFAPNGESGS